VSVEHAARLSRVEDEVGGVKQQVTRLEAQMRGFGDILSRIESGISEAHQRFEDDKQASRVNPIALATVLITIISILVGGAWTISGQLARFDERSTYQQRAIDRMTGGDHGFTPQAN
jgi:hypothetical protein